MGTNQDNHEMSDEPVGLNCSDQIAEREKALKAKERDLNQLR